MSWQQFLQNGWQWDPFTLALLGAALALAFGEARRNGRLAWLALAWGILALTLASPLATLARGYLFSAHMLQHLLLLLVIPALWWLGSAPVQDFRSVRTATPRFASIAVSWLAGVGGMWLWHAPALCDAAGSSTTVFRTQVLSLLAMGALFWRPVFGRGPGTRVVPLAGIAYLFSACLACTLLGIYLSFTPVTVCSIYVHPADPYGILPGLREGWGLSPSADQQIGGLMMWVPACLIYLAGIIDLLARWYSEAPGAADTEPSCCDRPAATPASSECL